MSDQQHPNTTHEELSRKRAWFDDYQARIDAGVTEPPTDGRRYCCPCCGYPTLPERGGYDICELCNWEDDGQDDPHADEVWGGPNKHYSLAQARENFKHSLIMYHAEGDFCLVPGQSQAEIAAKKAMIAAFDAILEAPAADRTVLESEVGRCRRILRAEVVKKVRRYERNSQRKAANG